MGRLVAAYTSYYAILLIMLISGLWVMWDARRSGKPWGETIVWGLFAVWFIGLGPIIYIYWKKKFG
ncbi:MAG: hypothetical protein M1609_01155 [Firmicutes bacterium]|nr:hypothetical protein [Bacillota bacterium]MCL5058428.1 hypothetical protein [Actinomycetota bacterium]